MEYPNIKKLRLSQHMTQTAAAEIFMVSQQTLSMIENGKREPAISLLVAMSDYYNVSVDYIIGHSE